MSVNNLENNVILITGASGFIGRSLTERLLLDKENSKIILLSRTNHFESFKDNNRIISVIGNINNIELLVYILQVHKVTHVYHLAAEAIVSKYINNPREAYLDTVYGVTSMLEAVRVCGVPIKKIIVSTSYKVYGRSEPPYNEETCFIPGNTYETAKACQDFIAQDYFKSFNVPVIIFRSVNVYGPKDCNLSRLVPKSFSDIYQDKEPVVYSYAKDNLREFIYIDDLLDAMLIMQEKAKPGEVFCVGGEKHTIYEVVKNICDIAGYKGKINVKDIVHVTETREHILDSSKLMHLGWKIKVPLEEGLKKCHESYKGTLT